MRTAPLGKIAKIERNSIQPADIETGMKYVGLEHVDGKTGALSGGEVKNGELSSSKFRFTKKHILYGKLRPYLKKISRPDFEGICSTDILPIRPSSKVQRGYLFWYLRQQSVVDQVNSMTSGANLPRISPKLLETIPIPLIDIDEQKRIAAILDQADALRQSRRRAIIRLNDLSQSIFYEMFGDPSFNPHGFPVGMIRDLVREVKYGTSKKAHLEPDGLPVLRMGNITYGGELDLKNLKYVHLVDKEIEKYTTQKGDILFNRTNSKKLVGKTAVFDKEELFAIAGYLVRARTNEKANPYYIGAYLNSAHGKATLRNMCKNIVGMANINAQEFQDIKIIIPPIDLQNEYQTKLELIEINKFKHTNALNELETLFLSLQQRAFSGEL